MKLWIELISCIRCLREACSRQTAFLWMTVALCAWAVRPDLLGVTSLVRASFLHSSCYQLLLHFFHSSAVALPALLAAWLKLALKLFSPVTMNGLVLLAADGLKVAKEGKKMPGVKCLHQESSDNSKPQFIMGHSFQVLSLLVQAGTGQVLAVPLVARICEGLLWGRSEDKKTILDKLADIFLDVAGSLRLKALLVADAYYGNRKVILPLLAFGHHLISRVRKNTVAYLPAPRPKNPKRGRPRKYGRKVRLTDLFRAWQNFSKAPSPVYGERDVVIQYRCIDLLWRPVKQMVRFVLVKHPTRGRLILICTKLDLDPLDIIKAYGLRFKIEVSFKSALHTLGTYAYHFWMMDMRPIKRRSGNQNLSHAERSYRDAVTRKMNAYHRYVQLGCILQGLLMHLAVNFRSTVWASFGSWLRTMRPDLVPSELVVAQALRSGFPDFLLDTTAEPEITKFIRERMDVERAPGLLATG